jgi:hypothetical protein
MLAAIYAEKAIATLKWLSGSALWQKLSLKAF